MKKRIEQLEKALESRLTPTQEKNVCQYLRLVAQGGTTTEELGESYAKVGRFLPRLH